MVFLPDEIRGGKAGEFLLDRHFYFHVSLVIGFKENAIENVKERIDRTSSSQVSTDYLLTILRNFGNLYSKMTDLEKKEFYHTLIERIDLYPDYQADGRILKHIEFKFPVTYESEEDTIRLINENNVEVVALLQRLSNTSKKAITLDVEMEDYHRIKSEGR